MRFYIICRGLFAGSKPWVLAETPDEPYARDEANTWKTTFVVSTATSVPAPMAIPMSAWASAGASLTPSPTIATCLPSRWSCST